MIGGQEYTSLTQKSKLRECFIEEFRRERVGRRARGKKARNLARFGGLYRTPGRRTKAPPLEEEPIRKEQQEGREKRPTVRVGIRADLGSAVQQRVDPGEEPRGGDG